jgi:hypothetical protein
MNRESLRRLEDSARARGDLMAPGDSSPDRELTESEWLDQVTAYLQGDREQAEALWPQIRAYAIEHRRTHGHWVDIGGPDGIEGKAFEELRQMPYAEQMALFRSEIRRPGYWSRLGPASAVSR